ncbi:MAG TPA: GNAT family N-acetyltransferase [Rhodocyclaceae bacterium]|nr:GNAT family N-acetyltransferase [Rhodocyclaceae bacterium]
MQNPRNIKIRPFTIDDYDEVIRFWSTIEGITLNESDTLEAIAAFLERNPYFSVVAVNEEEKIVGAVLCGHNGRAGSLQHLAVAVQHRGKGIAQALVAYCFRKLAEAHVPRCNIFVYSDNDEGNLFWSRNGWADPTTWKVMQKFVEP